MPTYRTGDMWSAFNEADHFIVTTNSFIRRDGALVMGRGIAQQARDRWPGLDRRLGQAIASNCGHLGRYGLLLSRKLGAFQVKYRFKDRASLELIGASAERLATIAEQYPNHTFHLNFPGIGNGGLPIDQVRPLLEPLPDNIHIWSFS